MKKYYTICIVLSLLFIVPINIAQNSDELNGPMNSPWPMKCYDKSHTSQSPYSTEKNNGITLWKYRTNGWMDAGIAIDNNGILYFGDLHFYFYAVNQDGTLKWTYRTDDAISRIPALAEDGTIYFTSGSSLYALNSDGTEKWKFNVHESIYSAPIISNDGTIYFGNNGIHAINPNGTEKWTFPTGEIYSDPAISDEGTIYIGSTDTYLYAMNPDGTLKWKFKTGDEIHSHPSIGSDGTIFFGSNDEYIYAVNPNGSFKWKYDINNVLYSSIAIGKDDTLYAPDHDLFALNPDGTLKWKFDIDDDYGVSRSSPAISNDGTIYFGATKVGMGGGILYAINSDGTLKWQKQIASKWLRSSPSIGRDGTIYIGSAMHDEPNTEYGYLYAIGKGNNPPNKPTINGPTSGKIETSLTYNIVSSDQDNDQLHYYIEWGDGTNTGWKGPYNSGITASESHIWTSQGSYTIKTKAKDEYGLESDWSTLRVSMPKEKTLVSWLTSFIKHHPRVYELFNITFKR